MDPSWELLLVLGCSHEFDLHLPGKGCGEDVTEPDHAVEVAALVVVGELVDVAELQRECMLDSQN